MVVVHDLAAGEQVAGSGQGQGSGAGDPRMTARCLSKKSLFLPVSLPDNRGCGRVLHKVEHSLGSNLVLNQLQFCPITASTEYQRESMVQLTTRWC